MNNTNIYSFSGLRYLFIVGIFFHHCNLGIENSLGVQYGYIGVTFFLILSGFILSYAWDDRLSELNFVRFFTKRLIKLYPTALLFLFFVAIPPLLQHCGCWRYVVYHALMLQSWYEPCMYTFNRPAWFLGPLFFCYAAFPLLLKLNKNRPYLFYAIFFILLITYYWTIFNSPRAEYYAYFFPPFRLLDFMVGMGLAKLFFKIRERNNVLNIAVSNIIEISSWGFLLLFCILKNRVPYVIYRDSWYWIPMSVIILSFAFTNKTPGWLSQLFSTRPMKILGDSTMCFFLSHAVVIHYAESIVSINSGWIVMLLLIISTILSVLLHYYFEKPIANWLNKKLEFLY